MVVIRPEIKKDYPAIYEVNKLAFRRDAEARLVERLRNSSGFIPELSLVALTGGRVVGHVMFSMISIESPALSVPSLGLAPIAVLPDYQKRGIGSQLVRKGIYEARRLGHKIVIIVGHPAYYPRFGFTPAAEKGLNVPLDVPDEAFMVLELVPGALNGVNGTVKHPPDFEDV